MSGQTAFGRRRPLDPAPTPRPPTLRTPPLAPPSPSPRAAGDQALSPAAEAFRREIASSRSASRTGRQAGFAGWRRSQRGRRATTALLAVLLLSPGALCFVVQAPWPVSIGLQLAGLAAGWWLRRERRRRLRSIAAWDAPPA